MSNEPKWTSDINGIIYHNKRGYCNIYSSDGYGDFDKAKLICDTLNRLEADVERLKVDKSELDLSWQKQWLAMCINYDQLRTDIQELQKDNERLQSELERCKSERLTLKECFAFKDWWKENYNFSIDKGIIVGRDSEEIQEAEIITAFRASQPKTNE